MACKALSVVSSLALSRQPLTVWGDGSSVRDYIFVDDVVDAITAATAAPIACGIFNIGTGVGTTIKDLVEHIARATRLPIHVGYSAAPAGVVHTNVLDMRAAANVLKWRPETSIGEGLQHTAHLLRARMEAGALPV